MKDPLWGEILQKGGWVEKVSKKRRKEKENEHEKNAILNKKIKVDSFFAIKKMSTQQV